MATGVSGRSVGSGFAPAGQTPMIPPGHQAGFGDARQTVKTGLERDAALEDAAPVGDPPARIGRHVRVVVGGRRVDRPPGRGAAAAVTSPLGVGVGVAPGAAEATGKALGGSVGGLAGVLPPGNAHAV